MIKEYVGRYLYNFGQPKGYFRNTLKISGMAGASFETLITPPLKIIFQIFFIASSVNNQS